MKRYTTTVNGTTTTKGSKQVCEAAYVEASKRDADGQLTPGMVIALVCTDSKTGEAKVERTFTTTSNGQKAERVLEYIHRHLRGEYENFEKAKAEFAERFASNPADAIEWRAGSMIGAQQAYLDALRIARLLGNALADNVLDGVVGEYAALVSFRAALVAWREDLRDSIVDGVRSGNSTCPWHNAARDAKVAANVETARHMTMYLLAAINSVVHTSDAK